MRAGSQSWPNMGSVQWVRSFLLPFESELRNTARRNLWKTRELVYTNAVVYVNFVTIGIKACFSSAFRPLSVSLLFSAKVVYVPLRLTGV